MLQRRSYTGCIKRASKQHLYHASKLGGKNERKAQALLGFCSSQGRSELKCILSLNSHTPLLHQQTPRHQGGKDRIVLLLLVQKDTACRFMDS